MKELTKEKFPGVNGELYQVRVVDTGGFISTEIDLVYEDKGQEKTANLRNDQYPSGTELTEIIEKTKADLLLISIVKRATGLNLI